MCEVSRLTNWVRRIVTTILITSCVFVPELCGQSIASEVTIPESEARHLLQVYIRSKGYDTRSAKLDIEVNEGANNSTKSSFYLYDVYADTPQRLVTIGSYGVNAETGDIWERLTCRRVESDAVAKLQRQIRDSSGMSASEWKRISDRNPCF